MFVSKYRFKLIIKYLGFIFWRSYKCIVMFECRNVGCVLSTGFKEFEEMSCVVFLYFLISM